MSALDLDLAVVDLDLAVICWWLAPGGGVKSVANIKYAFGLLVALMVGRRASM